ncbi:hypothetical protein P389DRAFT_79498 [Cystobasidium minutum MCA 4210]|uniref:uncharacterized protein n=1 Tax=Cystobasidium minutum MCA 4210 TaxID=1397322 RepID=UPI0034CF01DC|eukprot:jgi/Rhomi1/79498/CE79497_467
MKSSISRILYNASKNEMLTCTCLKASSLPSSPSSRMIANYSRRLYGQQGRAASSSLSMSMIRSLSSRQPSSYRHYASSSLQNQPPKQEGNQQAAIDKQREANEENYGTFAGPAMHTLGVFRRIFRYAVFASVAIVVTGATVYLSVHTYVEYIALHGRSRIPIEGSNASTVFPPEELVPAFSGAHLGGGTDPNLTWRARNAARAAWIALNLSKGGISDGGASTMRDVAVPDMAWLSAERYLKFALGEIEKQDQRASSPEEREKTKNAERELHFQLAALQSKLGGPRGLREARANWLQLLRKMPANVESMSPVELARWLELQRRLADVNVSLANLDKLGHSDSIKQSALKKLEDALTVVLTGNTNKTSSEVTPPVSPVQTPVPPEKPSSSGFSLRNIWSGSHETAPATSQLISLPADEIIHALKSAERPLNPAVKRAISRALIDDVSISAALKQLPRAEDVCNASLGYLRDASSSISTSPPDNQLYKTSMVTQIVLLQCYLAELLAAQRGTRKLKATSSDDNTRNILYEAVEASKQSLSDIKNFDKQPGFQKSALVNVYSTTRESAQRAAALAHSTRAVLAEVQDKDYLSALKDYEAAHEYANALKSSETEYSTMHDRTLQGIRRCREKLQ